MKKLVTRHDINALKRSEDTSECPDGERGPRRDHKLNKPISLIIIMHTLAILIRHRSSSSLSVNRISYALSRLTSHPSSDSQRGKER
jgi:hypothetical protein